MKAHRLLGHASSESTTTTAEKLGWKLTGKIETCESYSLAKSKQKAVPKISSHVKANAPGERMHIDLSKIKKPTELKTIGKSNWLIIVDELTKLKFSSFHETKGSIVAPICSLINKLKLNHSIITQYIRCDNAGENQTLEKVINGKDWRMAIQFEYTACATP